MMRALHLIGQHNPPGSAGTPGTPGTAPGG
jgi:hypothetical protein